MTGRSHSASSTLVWLFAATLFLSASLMFVIEPMVAKTVLPILGGTPMVWNTCVLFFQIMLLAGYAYAYGVTQYLGSRGAIGAYVLLLMVPLAIRPLAIDPTSMPPVNGHPVGWLLLTLTRSIGLPFFALAATTSILQRWFAETDHPSAKDPYFLYAASNLGSLLALLMYPSIIEPNLRLRTQRGVWAIGYGLFVLVACLSVVAGWRRHRSDAFPLPATAGDPCPPTDTARLSWPRRVRWIALAFVPSSLMLAVTTYFSTDIAPVPLFWIVPLSLYLLTFVAVFSGRLTTWQSIADRFMPILVLPLVLLMMVNASVPLWLAMPLHLTAFAVAAIVCHGRLADDRPEPAHLTEFYFWIAFGGMVGGLFNTLAAPLLFNTVAEYPIVLVLACAARYGRQQRGAYVDPWAVWTDLGVPVAVGTLTALFIVVLHPGGNTARLFVTGLGLPACLAFTQSRAPVRFTASLAAMLVAGTIALSAQRPALYSSRTFFGVYRVSADPENRYHALFHGTTLHGLQAVDPARQSEPLTYFHRNGPMGQAFAGLPSVAVAKEVAVVGLGAGALASYRTPAQQWTFYEIDPEVERIARTPGYFTYLSECRAQCRVVLGDARQSLMHARPYEYGLIVLDAFSSDAIPTHLLTTEALSLYLSRLTPDGALAFHITNRHLSLAPILARLAESYGLTARTEHQTTGTPEQLPSEWMVMARRPDDLGSLTSDPRWTTPPIPPSTPLWTDDFSNILSVLNLSLH